MLAASFSGAPKSILPEPVITVEAGLSHSFKEDENAEQIPWLFDRPLTWDDFLSEPKRNTDAVASTSTSLGISYQLKNSVLSYEIICNFSKTRSWGLVKTPYILAHEQAHFDITEIFARKLHKQLQNYKFEYRTYKQDISRIYQQIVAEKEAFQEAYDKQTDHSRKRVKQYEWLDKIETLLQQSEAYASYP